MSRFWKVFANFAPDSFIDVRIASLRITFGVRYDCAPLGKVCYININNPCYYF